MTRQGRAEIIGHYPTAGAGGSRVLFLMPGPEALLLPRGRPLDAEGNIVIEGTGVAPTIHVPVSEETLFFSEGDVLLETANAVLMGAEQLPFGAAPNTEPGQPVPAGSAAGAETPPAEEATPEPSEEATPEPTEEATQEASTGERITVTLGTP
jgi:C-terminal processing protease CtpA/Prc